MTDNPSVRVEVRTDPLTDAMSIILYVDPIGLRNPESIPTEEDIHELGELCMGWMRKFQPNPNSGTHDIDGTAEDVSDIRELEAPARQIPETT